MRYSHGTLYSCRFKFHDCSLHAQRFLVYLVMSVGQHEFAERFAAVELVMDFDHGLDHVTHITLKQLTFGLDSNKFWRL